MKFKRCCGPVLERKLPRMSAYTAYDEERFAEALQYCRADLTQYIFWYRRDTEPMLRSSATLFQELVDIDISALSAILDMHLACCRAAGVPHEFAAAVEAISELVPGKRWQQRIAYYRTLAALTPDWDDRVGRDSLAELGCIEAVVDVDILELYLHLFGSELGYSDRAALVDRIAENASTPGERLHYRALKGVDLIFIGDSDGGCRRIEAAVERFRAESEGDVDSYAGSHLGGALWILGVEKNDDDLLDQAREVFEQTLHLSELNDAGRAVFCSRVADCYAAQGHTDSARSWYLRSLDYEDTHLSRILLAQALITDGDLGRARDYLDSVDYSSSPEPLRFDHAHTLARLALATEDASLVELSKKLLRDLDVSVPLFREMRDGILLELTDGRGDASRGSGGPGFLVARWIRRNLTIQPNFFGLGINADAMLERYCRSHEEKDGSEIAESKANDT